MLARRCLSACGLDMPQWVDTDAGMYSMTLTFLDSGLEGGFAKERSPKLIRNLALCGLATGGSFGVSVVLSSPWNLTSDKYPREQERDILLASAVLMAVGMLLSATVSFACFLPSTIRSVRPIVVELAAVLISGSAQSGPSKRGPKQRAQISLFRARKKAPQNQSFLGPGAPRFS